MKLMQRTTGRQPVVEPPSSWHVMTLLWWGWRRNWSVGRLERGRGLHYWLGYEYALILPLIRSAGVQRWVDVGAGAHSVFPYLLAGHNDASVTGVDIKVLLSEPVDWASRASAAGLTRPGQVKWVRGDARRLPMADMSIDGVTAVSALEHLTTGHDDRKALEEIYRVLRPGGRAIVTVPFPEAGSHMEHRDGEPFQRVEGLPLYALSRKLPWWADRSRRPVHTLATLALMTPYPRRPACASAILLEFRRPTGVGQ